MRIKLFSILLFLSLTVGCVSVYETNGLIEVHRASSIDEAEQEAAKICGPNKTPELTSHTMGRLPGPSGGAAFFRCSEKQTGSKNVTSLPGPPTY